MELSTAKAKSSDPFLSDDFYPLAQAQKAILAALRADETSSDADLYRRIASNSMNVVSSEDSSNLPHSYRSLKSTTPMTLSTYSSSNASSANVNTAHDVQQSSLGSPLPRFLSPTQPRSSAGRELVGVSSSVSTRQMPNIHSTMSHTASINLPPYLANIIKETKLSSLMGLLPDANMVWVSVDDALYLWEYDSSALVGGSGHNKEDFVCFKVPSGQCVVSVGVVKPKKGEYA